MQRLFNLARSTLFTKRRRYILFSLPGPHASPNGGWDDFLCVMRGRQAALDRAIWFLRETRPTFAIVQIVDSVTLREVHYITSVDLEGEH